jgi:hypothetical protein
MSDRILFGLVVIAALAALLTGCEPTGPVTTQGVLTRNAANPPLPPPPPGVSLPAATPVPDQARKTNPFDRPATAASEPTTSAAPAAEPTYSPTEPTTSASKPSIRLSVGIALPQTLPDGTQIGVSVDYKLTGNLNPSAKYLWVIQSRQGETAMEVQLKPQGGNLASFLPIAIRPEDSPFKAWIDEVSTSGSRLRVSNVESLQ